MDGYSFAHLPPPPHTCSYIAAVDGQVEQCSWTVPHHPGKGVYVQTKVLKSQATPCKQLPVHEQCRKNNTHLRPGQDVRVGLDPSDDLAQDDAVRKNVHLGGDQGQASQPPPHRIDVLGSTFRPTRTFQRFTFSLYSSPLRTSGAIQ